MTELQRARKVSMRAETLASSAFWRVLKTKPVSRRSEYASLPRSVDWRGSFEMKCVVRGKHFFAVLRLVNYYMQYIIKYKTTELEILRLSI